MDFGKLERKDGIYPPLIPNVEIRCGKTFASIEPLIDKDNKFLEKFFLKRCITCGKAFACNKEYPVDECCTPDM